MIRQKLAIHGGDRFISEQMADEIREATRWPRISESTVQKCAEMLRRGAISMASGDVVTRLEDEFKAYIGTKHCLLQNNGTSTLHSAYFAVGVKDGDEVIVPSHTWTATVTPLLALGGVPVFCDIEEKTLNVDPDDIERKITPRTKAICVVHLWGNVCDMDRIMDISRRYGIPVIEDCSHAHGATYQGKRVGSIGAVGCFSMQGSKTLPGGELGAIVTNDDEMLNGIVILGHQGRIAQTALEDEYKRFEGGLGFKYRPFPLAVQIALDQLAILEETNLQRRLTVNLYNEAFRGIRHVKTVEQLDRTDRGCYSYVFLFDDVRAGITTAKLVEALQAEGMDAALMRYKLVHKLPPFEQYPAHVPVTEQVYPQMIMLAPFTISDESKLRAYVDIYAKTLSKVIGELCE